MYQSRKELQERICYLPGRPGGRGTGAGRHLHRRFQRLADGDLHRPQHGHQIRHERHAWAPSPTTTTSEVFIGRSMAQARAYSEEIAGLIDEEIKALLDTAYTRCRQILSENMDALERTAQYLLEFETMSADDFKLVFDDPDALEQRKAEERTQREREESERAAKEARLKAEREAERQRQQEVAEAIFQGEPPKDQKPPQTPDPF